MREGSDIISNEKIVPIYHSRICEPKIYVNYTGPRRNKTEAQTLKIKNIVLEIKKEQHSLGEAILNTIKKRIIELDDYTEEFTKREINFKMKRKSS